MRAAGRSPARKARRQPIATGSRSRIGEADREAAERSDVLDGETRWATRAGTTDHPKKAPPRSALQTPQETPGIDDHPGDLARADDLAVAGAAADVPCGDREAVQPPVGVRR